MKVSMDLHIHSCLSPCGDNEMTPNNIVNMACLKGLDIIAVTDHNSMLNIKPITRLAKKRDILVVPGIEVTTKEEIHILCYFPELENGLEFSKDVYKKLPNIENRSNIFGKQNILNNMDEIIGQVDKLLLNSVNLTIKELESLADNYGGIMIPAHIDRKSYSILSVLGFIPSNLKFKTLEVTMDCNISNLEKEININQYNFIKNSDAHYLKDINEPIFNIDIDKLSTNEVIKYLREKKSEII